MIVRPQTVAQHSLLLVGLIAGTGTVACTGAIEVISAEPFRLVCPGDDVTVSWEATGPVTFSASPSARVPSAGDPVGSFSTIIRSTTTFTVRSGTDSETIEVEVLESGESLEGIGADLICSNCGIPQWSTDVTREDFSTRLVVGDAIGNMTGRAVTARKDGSSTPPLSFAQRSSALNGVPLLGTWDLGVLVAPLDEGCACLDELGRNTGPPRRPPPILTTSAQVSCR